ncbi:MAG: hypothetical protein ACHQJ4_01015 [Ignavibacteria bacterium]
MNKIQKIIANRILGLSESIPGSHSANDYEADMYDYRPLTDSAVKGLNPIARDRQLDIVYSLFLKNGLAKRILEIRNDFIFGDGFKYSVTGKNIPDAKIAQAMEVLDEFWELNRMDLRFEKKGFDLSLNGMLVMPVFVNKINGAVKLGFVDPKNIDKVITNPMNVEEITGVKLKGAERSRSTQHPSSTLRVIRLNEDINDINYGLLDGDCFYFAINNVSNQPEGVSDLLGSADWLDMLDRLLYNTLQFVNALSKYFQDVELTGADEKRIEQWKQKNPVSQNLSRFVHNEKVKYSILTPNINNADPSEIVRLYKNIVLGSQGFPEHWFADGGNTNLATAVEQGTPVMRQLKNRQQYIIYILQTMLRFALHKAYGRREGFTLTKDELNKININIIAPEFERKDFNKIGDGMKKIGDLLEQAERQNWLTKESSGKIFRSVLDMIGYDLSE